MVLNHFPTARGSFFIPALLLSSAPMEQEKATLSTLCFGFSGEAAQNHLEAVGAET